MLDVGPLGETKKSKSRFAAPGAKRGNERDRFAGGEEVEVWRRFWHARCKWSDQSGGSVFVLSGGVSERKRSIEGWRGTRSREGGRVFREAETRSIVSREVGTTPCHGAQRRLPGFATASVVGWAFY